MAKKWMQPKHNQVHNTLYYPFCQYHCCGSQLRKLYLGAEGSPDSNDKYYYDTREWQQQWQYRYYRIENSNNRTD